MPVSTAVWLGQRRAASLLAAHFVYGGDFAEKPFNGTVLSLVPSAFVYSKPLYGFFVALGIIHEQIGRHGADGGIQMLVHKTVGAVLEDLHFRTQEICDEFFRIFLGPCQFLLGVAVRHLISRAAEDFRSDTDAVGGDAGMDTGIVKIFQ